MLRETLIHLGESETARRVVTRTALRGLAHRFVPGETVDSLIQAIRGARERGLTATANFLGEAVHDEANATHAAGVYHEILERLRAEEIEGNVSLKFTQLGQDVSDEFLAKTLGPLLDRAEQNDAFVRFDMEDSKHTDRTLAAFERLWHQGRRGIGVVIQSYLRRSAEDVDRLIELQARVRLCKGAYAEPESTAFQERSEVDDSFVSLMKSLLARGAYPAIATHDERMIRATTRFARDRGIEPERFEFQMLHGVRRDIQDRLVGAGWRVRVYIPFGSHWYPYLMRRLAERPANLLFMAGSVVKESPIGFLWPGPSSEVDEG
jgi:proline dehydrogenase